MPTDEANAPAHPRWTLLACILASSLSFVEGSVLNVALPAIRASFSAGASEVQWVVNAYLLPLSALLLLGGALGDHYGRRRLLILGTGLFGAASLLCALAPGLALLLAGRVLQGIGAALLLPNSLALLNATFEGEARGRAIGIWAAVGAGAAAIAPLIGGWLVDHVGWPAIFYINLPLAAGAMLIAARFAAESRNPDAARTDYPGALLATLGLFGVTYALTLWSVALAVTPTIVGLGVAGLVLLGLFLWVEAKRGDKAMMPLAMFANRCFVGTNLLTFLLYGAFGAVMLLIPYVLIEAAGYSPLQAGLALTPLAVVIAVASPLMGKLAARIGGRIPLTAGPVLVGAGLLLAQRIGVEGRYMIDVLPAILVLAAGMALAVAPLTSTVLSSVDQRHAGTASGLNSAVARTGGLIATALLGAVLAAKGEALVSAFHTTLLVAAVVSALAGLAAWLTVAGPEPQKRTAAEA
ncbi:MFS transporter [Sphingomonas astaxanthinifaciens]|uniref:MFS transporter n=1 Tax=Sphingomonas astaxanthinifaciens DSM 22298 TaxID=1123267 RepID=A0ABQ5Z3W8_9SPHN|nr:MFS transporter [Sphingomonas astaxanthinifaciens]GLR46340.1 MFS transporter [Sphingomonas astaxanthinifaciens DSM 22298]